MDKFTRKECDSYHSTKCIGVGNGRRQSPVTQRLRRQVNKKRRQHDKRETRQQLEVS